MKVKHHGEEFIEQLSGISLSRLYLQDMLDRLTTSVATVMESNVCALLLLDDSRQTLLLMSSHGLDKRADNTVRIKVEQGVSGRVVREKRTIAVNDVRTDPDYHLVPETGEEWFLSMLAAPIMDGEECVGVIYIQNTDQTEYPDSEIEKLSSLAKSVAGSIRVAWRLEQTRRKAEVLSELNDFARFCSSTNDIDQITSTIINYASKLIGSKIEAIWLTSDDDSLSGSHYPESVGDIEWMRPIREGIVAHSFRNKEPVRIDDINSETRFEGLDRVAKCSVLCHPMVFHESVIGVICVGDRKARDGEYCYPFSGEEDNTLAAIAQMSAEAIVRAGIHKQLAENLNEHRRNVKELTILFQLSLAMQRTISLDDLLAMILSCVTVGEGLGFNRAILFLHDEGTGVIKGKLGLGPSSGVEAENIWMAASEGRANNRADLAGWLVKSNFAEITKSRFHQTAISYETSIHSQESLAKVLRNKKPLNIKGNGESSLSDSGLTQLLQNDQYAIVPLIVRDTALGAILVDNFVTRKEITDSDLEILTRFAAPAAWKIQNVKLLEKLASVNTELLNMERQMARVEKFLALGEIHAELAHELKNPLTSIGGFARRLEKKLDGGSDEHYYSSIIVNEVERLESLLTNTLEVTKEGSDSTLQSIDLNSVVEQTVDLYWRAMSEMGIRISISLAADLPPINADYSRIKQVIINLLINAMEALSKSEEGTYRMVEIRTESVHDNRSAVRFSVSDNGGGIPPSHIKDIFNPYFTTKPTGTGLGLSLSKKIVLLLNGVMEIDNRPGVGVTFSVTLPAS